MLEYLYVPLVIIVAIALTDRKTKNSRPVHVAKTILLGMLIVHLVCLTIIVASFALTTQEWAFMTGFTCGRWWWDIKHFYTMPGWTAYYYLVPIGLMAIMAYTRYVKKENKITEEHDKR